MTENPRPPDWENPYPDIADGDDFSCPIAYEAGADGIYPFAFEQGKAEGRAELIKELLAKDTSIFLGAESTFPVVMHHGQPINDKEYAQIVQTTGGWLCKEPGWLVHLPLELVRTVELTQEEKEE